MKDEQEIEAMVQKTNPTPNRLTPADIDACIVSTQYYQFPGTSHMVCCLMLKNGFTVIGESSSVDPLNFSAEIGRKVSREDARKKIWMLEGYLLKENMHRAPLPEPPASARVWDKPPTVRQDYPTAEPELTSGQKRFAEGKLTKEEVREHLSGKRGEDF